MAYSTGVLVASAIIITKKDGADPVSTPVAVDDTLSNVVYAGTCPCDETIESATVKGFMVVSKENRRGAFTQIIDCIPNNNYDPEGPHFGTADEVLAVDGILVEIPAAEEDGTPEMRVLRVANIKELTAAAGGGSTGEDVGTEP